MYFKTFLVALVIIFIIVVSFFIGSMRSRLEKVEIWQRNVEMNGLID